MLKKIIITFFIIYSTIFSVKADESLRIYSRAEWGANEEYRYQDSKYWKDIFKRNANASKIWNKKWATFSQAKKDRISAKNKIRADKNKKMRKYLSDNFLKYIKVAEYNKFEGKNKLAWGITKTNYVKNIVIHHTYSEYKDSFVGIKNIYKYHSLSRQWGDIGYHYIIGYNGEIFEGRAGGDYVVGAHDTWNNYSTVGISIMGNYDKRKLSDKQYQSLKKLVSHLTKKYGIDLNKKIPYHRECFGKSCKNGLKTNYYYPIVGHRDGKGTACPGEHIYNNIIPKLLKDLQPETKGYELISYKDSLINKSLEKIKKENYIKEIDKYNWKKLKNTFNKLSERKKNIIAYRLKLGLKGKKISWKEEILYKRVLVELNLQK